MEDLPILAFEKVLSYLELNDLLSARTVSKGWLQSIDNYAIKFGVRSLFVSDLEKEYFSGHHRLMAAEFAKNYISSPKLHSLFGHPMLSALRHLRVCDLDVEKKAPELFDLVNSLVNLESLDLVRVLRHVPWYENLKFKLTLPKLKIIHLDDYRTNDEDPEFKTFTLTLDAPRLSEIQCLSYFPYLDITYPESIETVWVPMEYLLDLQSLKNLKVLHCSTFYELNDSLLSSLQQLKEIHLTKKRTAFEQLHDQKRRNGRSELKIYYHGLCLDSPDDYPQFPDTDGYPLLLQEHLRFMAANYSRLADALPLHRNIYYSDEAVRQMPADFWPRLSNLSEIETWKPVTDEEQFLQLLANCPGVRSLMFNSSQDLFWELCLHPSSLKIQALFLEFTPDDPYRDLSFLLELENLIELTVWSINIKIVPKIFKRLRFMRTLSLDDMRSCQEPLEITKISGKYYLKRDGDYIETRINIEEVMDVLEHYF